MSSIKLLTVWGWEILALLVAKRSPVGGATKCAKMCGGLSVIALAITFRGLAPARAVREPLDSNKFKIFLKIFKGVGRESPRWSQGAVMDSWASAKVPRGNRWSFCQECRELCAEVCDSKTAKIWTEKMNLFLLPSISKNRHRDAVVGDQRFS